LFVLQQFLEHIQELRYEEKPDYDLLQNVFRTSIARRGYKESDLFDWEKESNSLEDEIIITNPAIQQQQQQQQPQTQTQQPVLSSINNKLSAYVFLFFSFCSINRFVLFL